MDSQTSKVKKDLLVSAAFILRGSYIYIYIYIQMKPFFSNRSRNMCVASAVSYVADVLHSCTAWALCNDLNNSTCTWPSLLFYKLMIDWWMIYTESSVSHRLNKDVSVLSGLKFWCVSPLSEWAHGIDNSITSLLPLNVYVMYNLAQRMLQSSCI